MPPPPPGAFPLTHLWFLYYLLVLYVVVLTAAQPDRRARSQRRRCGAATDRVGARLVAQPARPRWCWHCQSAVALYFRARLDRVVRHPDARSVGHSRSSPRWSATAPRSRSDGSFTGRPTCSRSGRRQWPLHLGGRAGGDGACACRSPASTPTLVPAAPGATKLGLRARLRRRDLVLVLRRPRRSRPGSCRTANATIRYVADASYWIYLVHLPIVAALQVLVGKLPWHWSIKFPLILVVEPGGAVRELSLSRAIDVHRPDAERAPVSAARRDRPELAGRPGISGAASSTELPRGDRSRRSTGVHKRYGKTVALAGLDLEVRARRAAGGSRSERRRQVHGDLAVARAARARRGRGAAARRLAARRRNPAPRRRDDAGGRTDARAPRARADRARRRATTRTR